MGERFSRWGGLAAAVAAVLVVGTAGASGAPGAGPLAAEPPAAGPPPLEVAAGAVLRATLAAAPHAGATPLPAGDRAPLSPVEVAAAGSAAPTGTRGIPGAVQEAYRQAAALLANSDPGCHLDWSLLAAIGRIESGHARAGQVDTAGVTRAPVLGPRLDGSVPGTAVVADSDGGALDGDPAFDRAVGPMQFLPGTWRAFGSDGDGDGVRDPHDVVDAALAAGRYLCAGGDDLREPRAVAAALFRYNRSAAYGLDVLAWARTYRTGGSAAPGRAEGLPPALAAAGPPAPGRPPLLPAPPAVRLPPAPAVPAPLPPAPAPVAPAADVIPDPGTPSTAPDPGAPSTAPEPSEPGAEPSTEPAATEPAATEPTATEPTATEPAATEPAATEPAATGAALAAAPAAAPAAVEPTTPDAGESPTPAAPDVPTPAADPPTTAVTEPPTPAPTSAASEPATPAATPAAAEPATRAPTPAPTPGPGSRSGPAADCAAEPVVLRPVATAVLPEGAGLLLRFPPPDVPPGCRVVGATLQLDPGSPARDRPPAVRRVTQAWSAGTGTEPASTDPEVLPAAAAGPPVWTVTELVADPAGDAVHGLLVQGVGEPAGPATLTLTYG